MANKVTKILLTGATGYIGGSVLAALVHSNDPIIQTLSISCLIRGNASRIAHFQATYGSRVKVISYSDLSDTTTIKAAASDHDIVINTTDASHAASGIAVVQGLADRQKHTNHKTFLIWTSGVANVADLPISTGVVEHREFDDLVDDVPEYERERQKLFPFPQGQAEREVMEAAKEAGVAAVALLPPLIFGTGTGTFNRHSIQIPLFVRGMLGAGRGFMVGQGDAQWDHVHVEDLADLYLLMLKDVLQHGGKGLTASVNGENNGSKSNLMFCGNGRHEWKEVFQGIADALVEAKALASADLVSIPPENVAAMIPGVSSVFVEIGSASNARTKASTAQRLGWKPSRGEDAWKSSIKADVHSVLESLAAQK